MPRKPAAKKTEPKTPKKKTTVEKTVEVVVPVKHGVEEGIYSKTVYDNGQKISFDIDWDKLKEHMKTV